MPPITHREPGLAGAVLESEEMTAELVCDGVHVHPAVVRMALAAKRPSGMMAITDGTAGAGLPTRRQDVHRRPTDYRQRCRLPGRWHAGGQRVDDGSGVCEADDAR